MDCCCCALVGWLYAHGTLVAQSWYLSRSNKINSKGTGVRKCEWAWAAEMWRSASRPWGTIPWKRKLRGGPCGTHVYLTNNAAALADGWPGKGGFQKWQWARCSRGHRGMVLGGPLPRVFKEADAIVESQAAMGMCRSRSGDITGVRKGEGCLRVMFLIA